MPYEKGSCLAKEYTEVIEQINELINKAKEKYESLPSCIKDAVAQKYYGNTLGYYLTNGEISARRFAEEFGIKIKQ